MVLVLGLGGGLVVLLAGTDVLDVRAVEVSGAGTEIEPEVREAARVEPDTSLVWLDTARVAGAVGAVPRVATVDVRRSLPGTVTVAVTERVPVLAVPGPPDTPVGLAEIGRAHV